MGAGLLIWSSGVAALLRCLHHSLLSCIHSTNVHCAPSSRGLGSEQREEAPCPHSADILEGQTACARHQQSVPVPVHPLGRPAGKAGLGRAGVAAANQEVRLVGVGCLESLGSTRSPVGSRARVGGPHGPLSGLWFLSRGDQKPPQRLNRGGSVSLLSGGDTEG